MNTRDLLYNLTWRMKINQPLVNSHLISIPSFRTLTAWSFACRDFEDLCWQSNRSLDFKVFVFRSSNQIGTDLYELQRSIEKYLSRHF